MVLVTWSLESHHKAVSLGAGDGWWRGKSVLFFGLKSHVPLMVYALKYTGPTFWVILGISKPFLNICTFALSVDLEPDFLM